MNLMLININEKERGGKKRYYKIKGYGHYLLLKGKSKSRQAENKKTAKCHSGRVNVKKKRMSPVHSYISHQACTQ